MIRDVKNRTRLEQVIPIATPFVCHIEVTNACNFKCKFCGTIDNPQIEGIKRGFMDYGLFCKIIDDLSEFDGKLKHLGFHVWGEPLLHPQIAEMIAYAKEKGVAEKLILYTNGSMLTPQLSRALVDAGVDYIQISIEHISKEGYKKIAGVDIEYNNLLANIGYLCAYKRDNCVVSAKILDSGLTDEEKKKFYEDFKNITSECHIETLIQSIPVDIKDTTMGQGVSATFDGYEITAKDVCTQPFYFLAIYYNGLVAPCECDWIRKIIIGDASKETIKEIWQGEKLKEFRKMQLSRKRSMHPSCRDCQAINVQLDDIDPYADMLLERIRE